MITFLNKSVEHRFQGLVNDWQGCTKCPLSSGRRKIVHYRGVLPCKVLFVGEAPGESEDSLGFPFVGEAGQELDYLLGNALMKPFDDCPPECRYCGRTVYSNSCNACGAPNAIMDIGITNICACIPRTSSELGSGQLRPPTKEETKACADRLVTVIDIALPKLIVCLGRAPVSLIKHAMKLWLGNNIPIETLLHPSAILRDENPNTKALSRKRWIVRCASFIKDHV